jgi:hypothetical protein
MTEFDTYQGTSTISRKTLVKCLGTAGTNRNLAQEDFGRRWNSGNAGYRSVQTEGVLRTGRRGEYLDPGGTKLQEGCGNCKMRSFIIFARCQIVIKSRRKRWILHVTRTGDECRLFVGRPEETARKTNA